MFIDSHAHLTSSKINEPINLILERAKGTGVDKIVNICTDKQSLEKGLELAERYSWVYNAAATTPHDVEREGEVFFPLVEELALQKKLVAVGETGLDYYYEHAPREIQKKILVRYFALAKKAGLPLIIHCREAFEDLFLLADSEYKQAPAVLHCFTGNLSDAKGVLERGWFLSFSGIITFKKSEELRRIVEYVPLERVLIETDTPYLAPQSHRGKLNEPAFIGETAAMIAKVKNISLEEVATATTKNAYTFFSF